MAMAANRPFKSSRKRPSTAKGRKTRIARIDSVVAGIGAFTLERVNPLGSSPDTRDVGGFDQSSRTIYLNIGNAFDVTTGRFTGGLIIV